MAASKRSASAMYASPQPLLGARATIGLVARHRLLPMPGARNVVCIGSKERSLHARGKKVANGCKWLLVAMVAMVAMVAIAAP